MPKTNLTPYEQQNVGELKLRKAHVPLRICLKLALKNMWKKKFRYLVMFLICSLSLTFLSVTIELNGEILRQNVYTMIENGYRFTEIYEHVEVPKEEIKIDPYKEYSYKELSANSYDTILDTVDGIILHEYEDVSISYVTGELENSNYFYTGYINTLIKYDTRNSYELLAGRLPNPDTQEVLVTDYLVEAFKYFKLYPSFNNAYDFLNQRISLTHKENYVIVGVIKTNYQQWSHFSNVESVNVDDKENYAFLNDFKFMNSVILNEEYFNLEKTGDSNVMQFTNLSNAVMGQSLAKWNFEAYNFNEDKNVNVQSESTIGFTNDNVSLIRQSRWSSRSYGTYPQNDDEIVISYQLINQLYGFNWRLNSQAPNLYDQWYIVREHLDFWDRIKNTEITINFTGIKDSSINYSKTYKIVGICESVASSATAKSMPLYQVTMKEYQNIYFNFVDKNEKILVELPSTSTEAYTLFNNALDSGYVINVWEYRNDIDSYIVDPFLDLASKAGLFIFVAFTMGIMWTIISIEIVDSKKEIGILRSIGLSGAKVSFIFVFQCASMILLSYFVGVYGGYKIIPYLNVGITDELNKVTLFMYSFTYRTPLYLGIFVVIMTCISTIIPLWKILSNKIIDVINERDS